jgi:Flp pilus assembly protein TadD
MQLSSYFHKSYIIVLLPIILFACQSTQVQVIPTESLYYDQGFSGFTDLDIETQEQVFYLDETAINFVLDIMEPSDNQVDQIEALIHAIFNRSELNLLYQAEANTVASDTFHSRAANCLSMSIMTYALAEIAGFDVRFQEIIIPEYWTRRAGFSLINGHINLKVSAQSDPNVYVFSPRSFQVDFDPQASRRSLPKKVVSKQAVLAMYYNNKSVDALLKKQYVLAYAYLRHALKTNPNFHSGWVNLGILYRLNGYLPQAEKAYQQALAIDSDSLTTWENLAYLYNLTDKETEAKIILSRVKQKRNDNPYYHVNLGEEFMEQHNWDEALAHFRKALTLDRSKHEVYFGLARAYYQIGNVGQSKHFLRLAKRKARNNQDEQRYQNKLDLLYDHDTSN